MINWDLYLTMLTKNDLDQIKNIVQETVQNEVSPLKNEVKMLKKDINNLIISVKNIRKDIRIIISLFDEDYTNLEIRTNRIEKHLNLT